MSEFVTLARPYAEAVFKRAKETGSVAEWSENLQFLALVMEDSELVAVAENPRVEQDRFTELLLDISKDQIKGEGKNFIRLLIENNRLKIVAHIRELY